MKNRSLKVDTADVSEYRIMNKKYNHKSSQAKRELKVSDCKLMHLREKGVLRSIKKGNAFYYHEDDIKIYKKGMDRIKE